MGVAEAGTLAVTYQDCGAKHAQVTDLQPTTIHTGATETMIGTGTSDEDVTSAHFTATVSAMGAQLSSCSGDGTQDIVCNLPAGTGKVTVKALTFPIAKGTVSIPVEVQTSRFLPASLASVDVHVAAEDQNGESVICLDVHTAKAMSEEAQEGSCTSDEQSVLADPQTVGEKANACGTSSYNIFTGNFNHDKFNDCFSASIGISKTCSECYAATGEYGAQHCKAACLLGWCTSGCLSCTSGSLQDLATCTGFTPATAEPCEDAEERGFGRGGTLALTFQDCGSKHSVVTDVQPTSFHTGTSVTITGTGTTDEDVTSALCTGTVSAMGMKLGEFSADGTEDVVVKLPLGAGKITVKALSFPLQKGTVELPVEVQTSRFIPASLANVEVHIEATDQNGESVLCVDVHTAKSVMEGSVMV